MSGSMSYHVKIELLERLAVVPSCGASWTGDERSRRQTSQRRSPRLAEVTADRRSKIYNSWTGGWLWGE